MTVQSSCLMINVTVGMWMGYRRDKETTAKVTRDAGAQPDAAQVNKHLVPRESLDEIITASSAVRSHLYANSLPWMDKGPRLIPRKKFITFMPEHEKRVNDYNAAADQFVMAKYRSAKAGAEFRMGEMFDPNDYPSEAELRRKFYVTLDIDGIGDSFDFRLQNDNSKIQARVTKAMDALWAKVAKPLGHFATKMSDEDKPRLHATTLTNLQAIAELIPELNFTEDPRLTALGEEIAELVNGLEIEDLKDGKNGDKSKTRKALGGRAAQIMDEMRGFMTGMGAVDDDE